jgi:1-acyl-sn-glycerol-3-phosphate acyltransferase
MKVKKTIYYSDPLRDDFAGNGISKKPLPKKFRFYHSNLIWFIFSSLIYYVIAIPALWIYAKIFFSFRIVGKRRLRKAHFGTHGFFVYGNHTSNGDAMFIPTGLITPRRTYVVCSDEAVSIRGIRWLEMMAGALPLPDSAENTEGFLEAVEKHIRHGDAILIFPEAHIWPYSARIRPFPDQSFTYPAQLNAPVIAVCTTYEEHRFFKARAPRAVLHVSDPFYPDMAKPLGERAHLLREAVYAFLVDTSSSLDNVEYYRYLPKKETAETPPS